ncbi:MAG: hypothetical protein L3J35_09995 [Bacteroidales bacterium]|nr:hypothetical protein [Bacteroidales bacterium]
MIITENIKLAELIHQNYHLIPIVTRFGIKFGFGDKSVKQVCELYGIQTDFFLEIVNAFNDKDYSPVKNLKRFPLSVTVNYLLKSHYYFNQIKLPLIEKLIHQLKWQGHENKKNKSLLNKFFNQYRTEVNEHTANEENEVYPFILEVEKNYNSNILSSEFVIILRNKSVNNYADTHSDLNSALLDLKNIIIKYLPAADNSEITEQILVEIFDLEKDMADHTGIENSVVIPVALEMENELRKQLS